jgi:serine/threonine protein kinase
MGVLHRDISIGNVLICQRDDKSTEGRLIDLDYAKHTTDVVRPILSQIKTNSQFSIPKKVENVKMYYRAVFHDLNICDEVVVVLYAMRDEINAAKYASAILEYKPNLKETTMVCVLAIAYRTYLYLFSASTTRYWSA